MNNHKSLGLKEAVSASAQRDTRGSDWQSDPTLITTPRVQLWTHNGTMAGIISSEVAVQMVKCGTHFVISCQAIGETTPPVSQSATNYSNTSNKK